jgi:hypothetical protein
MVAQLHSSYREVVALHGGHVVNGHHRRANQVLDINQVNSPPLPEPKNYILTALDRTTPFHW